MFQNQWKEDITDCKEKDASDKLIILYNDLNY